MPTPNATGNPGSTSESGRASEHAGPRPELPPNPSGTEKAKHAGGRPKGSPNKPKLAPVSSGEAVDLSELKALAPEESALAESLQDGLQFKPEEVEAILSLAVMELSHWILGRLERQEIQQWEADRWAKCTRIVFWKWLQKADAGILIWVLLTAGMFLSKKSLKPKEPKGGQANNQSKN